MTLKHSLEKLASHIAKKAEEKDTSLQESTDALKALTQLYSVLQKKGPKADENPNDGPTFDDFQSLTATEESNGRTASVPGRRTNS